MQTINLQYKGMMPIPDDYLCEDGLADTAVDLEMRNGAWHAVRQPAESTFSVDGFSPRHVQHMSDGKTFFFGVEESTDDDGATSYTLAAYSYGKDENGNVTTSKQTIENAPSSSSADAFDNFCHVGNIVCFTFDKMVKYMFYLDGKLKTFDRLPPRLSLKLTAMRRYSPKVSANSSEMEEPTQEYVNCNRVEVDKESALVVGIDGSKVYNNTELTMTKLLESDENIKKMEDRVFAAVNSARAQIMKKGYLMYPVMLRYAYRLYDGSTIMASPPILMYPMLPRPYLFPTPWQKYKNADGDAIEGQDVSEVKGLSFFFEAYRIFANIANADQDIVTRIKQWDGIVKSVDIFISPQMQTIETDELEYTMFEGNGSATSPYRPQQAKVSLKNRNIKDTLEGVSAFHLVKSIDINELGKIVYNDIYDGYPIGDPTNFNEYSRVLPDDLTNYTEKEKLEDSLYDNSLIEADSLIGYNKRLICGNVTRLEPSDYDLAKFVPQLFNEIAKPTYSDTYKTTYYTGRKVSGAIKDLLTKDTCEDFTLTRGVSGIAAYEITDNGKVSYISSMLAAEYLPKYLAITGNKCTAVVMFNGNTYSYIPLKRSDTINCSYNYPFVTPKNDKSTSVPSVVTMQEYAKIELGNIIKESEVNNPIVFTDGNSASCGSGSVLALTTNAQAVSTGQFGQYPILAFCSDGVFAVGVGTDGTLQSCSPYALDILSNAKSVASVRGMVTFITRNGLVGLGSSSERKVLLPGERTYPHPVKEVQTLLNAQGLPLGPYDGLAPDLTTYLTSGAQTAYDPTHDRLFVFNPKYSYTYVCDLSTFSWSVMSEQFCRALNEPDKCYLVAADGKTIWDYASDNFFVKRSGWILTRPFKMNAPDTFKTIGAVVQRGYFGEHDDNAVQQALFGSTNLSKWYPVRTSQSVHMRGFRGTPYKAFRLLAICKEWTQDLSLAAASLEVDGRLTDQLR